MFVDLFAKKRTVKTKIYQNEVPSIIFLKDVNKNILISLLQSDCLKIFKECKFFKNQIFRIFCENIKFYVKIQSFQIHSVKKLFLSIVFSSVSANLVVTISIPVNYNFLEKNKICIEDVSLKKSLEFIKIQCYISQIPDFIEIDMSLFKVDSIIFMKDICCLNFDNYIKLTNIENVEYLFKIKYLSKAT